MGWAYCGKNRITGEEMGYGVRGVCHHKYCCRLIDHGLAYLCGSMHEDSRTCQHYYCSHHLVYGEIDGELVQMCHECAEEYDKLAELVCDECGPFDEIGLLNNDSEEGDDCFFCEAGVLINKIDYEYKNR